MEVVITVEQENAMWAIGGLPPLQERLEEPLQERLEEPLQERLEEPLQKPLEEPLQEPLDMGLDSDGPLHSPSGSSSQPLDFMGAGLHLDGEEGGDSRSWQAFYCPLRIARWQAWKLGRIPNRRGPGIHAGQLHAF